MLLSWAAGAQRARLRGTFPGFQHKARRPASRCAISAFMPTRLVIAYVLIALMAAAAAALILYYLAKRKERVRILRGHGQRRRPRP